MEKQKEGVLELCNTDVFVVQLLYCCFCVLAYGWVSIPRQIKSVAIRDHINPDLYCRVTLALSLASVQSSSQSSARKTPRLAGYKNLERQANSPQRNMWVKICALRSCLFTSNGACIEQIND
jgi:hypothetical protein